MTNSNIRTLAKRTHSKIRFLEDQLIALDHYLPETYDYLMRQLDLQKKTLAELEVQDHFSKAEEDNEQTD